MSEDGRMEQDGRGLAASDVTSLLFAAEGCAKLGIEWPVSGDATTLTEHNFFVPRK